MSDETSRFQEGFERLLADMPEPPTLEALSIRPVEPRLSTKTRPPKGIWIGATAALAVLVLFVPIFFWFGSDDSGTQRTADAVLLAELGDLGLISPVVLDDGTIVARAWLMADPDDQPQLGFGRSTDGGATWMFVPSEETAFGTGAELAAVGNLLVAPVWDVGTGAVLMLTSQDRGATWSASALPVPDGYLALGLRSAAVVVDEKDRFVVYGGNGKWISSDGVNWEAGIRDTSYRSLMSFPQTIKDVLVVTGEDDRIYAAAAGEALEVALEPGAEGVSLAARKDTVVAWGTIPSDSPGTGTWLGVTTDGRTWSERTSDLEFTWVHPLSDGLGAGYLGTTFDPQPGTATVYRSPDLNTWTEIAQIETGEDAGIYQVVEVDGGVLALAWGDEQTLWLIELGE